MSVDHFTPAHHGYGREKFLAIPPETMVTLGWIHETESDTNYARGRVCAYDHRVRTRTVDTDDDTLVLTAPPAESVFVSKVTTTGLVSLGDLEAISVMIPPTRPLRVTDVGVVVPPSLCGCSGRFWIDRQVERDGDRTDRVDIPAPGLTPYDRRLLTDIEDAEIVRVKPPTGPAIKYCVHDDRTHSDASTTEPAITYRSLELALTELNVVSMAAETDPQLDQWHRQQLYQTLADAQTALYRARRTLFEVPPAHDRWAYDAGLTTDWAHYGEPISTLQGRCMELTRAVSGDETLTATQRRRARFHLGQATQQLERLRPVLEREPGETATPTQQATPSRIGGEDR